MPKIGNTEIEIELNRENIKKFIQADKVIDIDNPLFVAYGVQSWIDDGTRIEGTSLYSSQAKQMQVKRTLEENQTKQIKNDIAAGQKSVMREFKCMNFPIY